MSHRRKQLGNAAACPIYDIKVKAFDDRSGVEAKAYVDKKLVGIVTAAVEDGAFHVVISNVSPEHRRCGLGTKLYTKVARWGCAKKLPLESDVSRSEHSQGFWAKQEAKQRARCITKAHRAPEPGAKGIQEGRGGCVAYRLTCPVTDLSGRRKRR